MQNVGAGGFSSSDLWNAKTLLGAFQIAMVFNNNIEIGCWPIDSDAFIPILAPNGLTKDNLINGTFKLIPFLKTATIPTK